MERPLAWIQAATGASLVQDNFADLSSPQGAVRGVNLSLVQTDSRLCQPGSLYVARVGENQDGHRFAASAVQNGAVAVLGQVPVPDLPVPQLLVQDTTVALGELAKAHLTELRLSDAPTVIGVTGSAGKTTTKDLLARILGAAGNVVAPQLSFNNEVGCPLTVLKANRDTDYLVLEMGASGPGHLDYLTRIAPLDVAVVLLVGRAHLEGFGSAAALAQAKGELVDGLLPGGVAVLNWDDPAVREMAPEAEAGETLFFSARGGTQAQVRATDVEVTAAGAPTFNLEAPGFSGQVELALVGEHQVSNALAAVSAAMAVGVPPAETVKPLERAVADSPHRMDVASVTVGSTQFTLVDDAYNANPDSMAAAFRVARGITAPSNRLLMVLGEMLELGPESAQIHAEVGEQAQQAEPAKVVLLGQGAQRYAAGITDPAGQGNIAGAADPELAASLIISEVSEGDVVLVKGSYGSSAWQVADRLRAAQAREATE